MPRVIFKCPYMKGGSQKSSAHLKNYVSYMATRDGVECLDPGKSNLPATEKQKKTVEELLRDFPLSKSMHEYADYLKKTDRANASAFIYRAVEDNQDQIAKRENYVDYIANRPRVQKVGIHGLFSATEESLVLSKIAETVAHHPGNIWMPIISLRREDAERLGYDNAERWRQLLSEKSVEMANAMKIPVESFRWYAAYHDEGTHPHVHMVCYSEDPSEGYLTKAGIERIKSGLAREIFRQDLDEVYVRQTQRRDELNQEAGERLGEIINQMRSGSLENERIQQLMVYLARELKNVSGKKKYGYLKASLKSVVDEVVDELARDARVAEAYRLWYELREDVLSTYKDNVPERLRLSQQKEFKRIKNIVIEEAMLLGDRLTSEMDEKEDAPEMTHPQIIDSHYADRAKRQGNTLDELNSVLRSVTRLLHHVGTIFREETPVQSSGIRVAVDSKLRRKIREKKMAQGHKADDHEPEISV